MSDPVAVHEAWAAVMADIPVVRKSERNNAPGANYDFRGIDTVLNVVGPVLRHHKVIVIPHIRTTDFGEILVGKDRKPMGHARVTVDYIIVGPSGDTLPVGSGAGEAFDSGDKATPKATSVAYRDFLVQALALPTGQPDVNTASYERSVPVQQPPADRVAPPLPTAKARVWEASFVHHKDTLTKEKRQQLVRDALAERGYEDDSVADLNDLAAEWSAAS